MYLQTRYIDKHDFLYFPIYLYFLLVLTMNKTFDCLHTSFAMSTWTVCEPKCFFDFSIICYFFCVCWVALLRVPLYNQKWYIDTVQKNTFASFGGFLMHQKHWKIQQKRTRYMYGFFVVIVEIPIYKANVW